MPNCKLCNTDKPENEFARMGVKPDGSVRRQTRCNTCRAGTRKDTDSAIAYDVLEGGAELAQFGTPIERACAEALLACGSVQAAAASVQLAPEVFRAHLHELKRRAAKRGFAPDADMTKQVPNGYHVKGVSTLYDADGNVSQQWVKSNRDEEHKFTALLDAMAHVADAWQGKADPVDVVAPVEADLLCVYPMGDPHLGMFAWGEETGEDFDLAIAERNLCAAVDQLVAGAPAAREALIINLGDFFHADNASNQTSRSHHALDVDTRWSKVMRVGIRTMRRCIDRALLKHEVVRVICEIGNHDDQSSVMLALCLEQYYEREPRVVIDTSPAKFHWYRFGSTLIGVTHGDTAKANELPGIMACDRKADWGTTDHRFWYTGHVHHDSLKEYPGVIVETFRTLAPRDSWHAAKGYRSGQDMKVDVIDRTHGRIQRNTVGVSQLMKGK